MTCTYSLTGTSLRIHQTGAATPIEFQIKKTLKSSPANEVLLAEFDGCEVIIKHFLTNNAAKIVAAAQAELNLRGVNMASGPMRVNQCLMAFPDIGMIVLSKAQGQKLSVVLDGATPENRAKLLKQAGAWIVQYGVGTDENTTFKPMRRIQLIKGIDLSHIAKLSDQNLLARLLADLKLQALALRGSKISKSVQHDDFVPINMFYNNGVLTGVDIQRGVMLPRARVAAQFLVWLQIWGKEDASLNEYGVSAFDFDAFLSADFLPKSDPVGALRFFIGEQFYRRFQHFYVNDMVSTKARQSILRYLDAHEKVPQPSGLE